MSSRVFNNPNLTGSVAPPHPGRSCSKTSSASSRVDEIRSDSSRPDDSYDDPLDCVAQLSRDSLSAGPLSSGALIGPDSFAARYGYGCRPSSDAYSSESRYSTAPSPDMLASIAPGPESCPTSSAITHFDPLRAYLREVQRHPLLTPEEEHETAKRYAETGDVQAAATLVTSNLRLVVKIAYEYRRAYRNILDLIQEGNIGLMQAVKRFDPCRGVKLSTYAAWWIRAYILRFVLANSRLVKLGTTQAQRRLFYNLKKEKERLSSMGIEPSATEIAKQLDVDESEVVEMDKRLASKEASLDAPIGGADGKQMSRMDLLPSLATGPDAVVVQEQFNAIGGEKIREFRKTLTDKKDIALFDERLLSDEPLTLQEIGNRFGVTRQRMRQVEARLLSRLRSYVREALREDLPED